MNEEYAEIFDSFVADFFHYMVNYGGLQEKTSHDYISRLKFLSSYYKLDKSLTEERIKEILKSEKKRITSRSVYNSSHALNDFHASLKKLLAFFKFNYDEKIAQEEYAEIKKVEENASLTTTVRTEIIKARIGQGLFRRQLIDYWHGCAVSGVRKVDITIASHIKPWRVADNSDRINSFNGLLLLPNLDKLFDKGYMTFDTNGMAHFSPLLSDTDISKMGINKDECHLIRIDDRHKPFLEYHNEHCFIE